MYRGIVIAAILAIGCNNTSKINVAENITPVNEGVDENLKSASEKLSQVIEQTYSDPGSPLYTTSQRTTIVEIPCKNRLGTSAPRQLAIFRTGATGTTQSATQFDFEPVLALAEKDPISFQKLDNGKFRMTIRFADFANVQERIRDDLTQKITTEHIGLTNPLAFRFAEIDLLENGTGDPIVTLRLNKGDKAATVDGINETLKEKIYNLHTTDATLLYLRPNYYLTAVKMDAAAISTVLNQFYEAAWDSVVKAEPDKVEAVTHNNNKYYSLNQRRQLVSSIRANITSKINASNPEALRLLEGAFDPIRAIVESTLSEEEFVDDTLVADAIKHITKQLESGTKSSSSGKEETKSMTEEEMNQILGKDIDQAIGSQARGEGNSLSGGIGFSVQNFAEQVVGKLTGGAQASKTMTEAEQKANEVLREKVRNAVKDRLESYGIVTSVNETTKEITVKAVKLISRVGADKNKSISIAREYAVGRGFEFRQFNGEAFPSSFTERVLEQWIETGTSAQNAEALKNKNEEEMKKLKDQISGHASTIANLNTELEGKKNEINSLNGQVKMLSQQYEDAELNGHAWWSFFDIVSTFKSPTGEEPSIHYWRNNEPHWVPLSVVFQNISNFQREYTKKANTYQGNANQKADNIKAVAKDLPFSPVQIFPGKKE